MKNISFFINTLGAAGGTQRVLTTLANLLVEDYLVDILIINDSKPFFKLDSRVNLKLLRPSGNFKIMSILNLNKLIFRELKSSSCDYYISLDSNSILFQSLYLPKKTRLLIWEHFSLTKNSNKLLFRISRYYATKRAQAIVLLSNVEKKDWAERYNIPESKLKHIYNPITIEEVNNHDSDQLYRNKKVLAIGNNIHIKGFDYLIQAWSLLEKKGWTLEIIGLKEKEQEKLEKLMTSYSFKNKVIIKGRVSNIRQKYLDSSIYCLCSRNEATPLVLIESQYVGLPAVIFDNCPGALELLNDSGNVVAYNHVDLLSQAIVDLIDSKKSFKQISIKARQNADRFNRQTFKLKWKQILN
ncbi:Poly(glycerol-phosphate) alpha-glucosyltransferase [Flagellimonas maritima]|uniref:Poly(Glycerol-phosphate) alpha-glucosyltransferase n=1 Tax=Flagellimonas maritima TaxID=1383885 RepID=A0A2Z4LVL9_9FLAO|nr:glycosyltransferase [Allomuricauda aurantiaca]AWX45802.1 Poly(glycerol-phosphate) alpha-glucosyltransferase [Allomuricauda aurantiaca]